ncbi:MAG: hypothetical protein JST14_17595 [Bacteroidetes bacterium]|nr:hypothetical protein [Bacteroidota bacterium]
MKSILFTRIAMVIAVIQYAVHTVAFLRARPRHDADEVNLVEMMKSLQWNFGGSERSYWDFYFGYGMVAILMGLLEILLLWFLSGLLGRNTREALPFLLIMVVINVFHILITLKFFFILPATFDAAVTFSLLSAYLAARKETVSGSENQS